MPCNCGSNKKKQLAAQQQGGAPAANMLARSSPSSTLGAVSAMSGTPDDSEVMYIEYASLNTGGHRVVGPVTGKDYGYRSKGDRFYVLRSDQAIMPHIFSEIAPESLAPDLSSVEPPPAPVLVQASEAQPEAAQVQEQPAPSFKDYKPFDLQTIPGVTTQVALELQALGAHTLEDVAALTLEALTAIKTIGPARAGAILHYAQERLAAS
jgi:hypothetical protein